MFRRFAFLLSTLVMASIAAPEAAHAGDDPISAKRLTLKRMRNATGKVVFTSQDPSLVVPALGSADDPRTAGAWFELFLLPQGDQLVWHFHAQGGEPGWVAAPNPPSYRYANRLPFNRQVGSLRLMNNGRRGLLNVTLTTHSFTHPIERIGVRLQMGSQRSCAFFDAANVTRDTSTTFIAVNASATRLADCSDSAMWGVVACGDAASPQCNGTCPDGSSCESNGTGCECLVSPTPVPGACELIDDFFFCHEGICPDGSQCGPNSSGSCGCISAAQPCGDTAPVCNGECPSGEVCSPTGGLPPGQGCACLPEGSTGCSSFQQCSIGDCPDGQTCRSYHWFPSLDFCGCSSAGCGPGGAECPPGTRCIIGPPNFPYLGCQPY